MYQYFSTRPKSASIAKEPAGKNCASLVSNMGVHVMDFIDSMVTKLCKVFGFQNFNEYQKDAILFIV